MLQLYMSSRGGSSGTAIPIDSVVATTTAVGQWSMVKATRKSVVHGQSTLRNTVNADNGRLQRGINGLVRKNNIPQLVIRVLCDRFGSSG